MPTGPEASSAPLRGTQSFVRLLGETVRRPEWLAIELAWRWTFGIPALAVCYYQAMAILARTPLAPGGLDNFSLTDPDAAAQAFSTTSAALLPPLQHLAFWLGPALAVGWAFSSGIGRSILLKRMIPGSSPEPGTLIGLQFFRIVSLCGMGLAWYGALHLAARATLQPAPAQVDFSPNLVGYFAWVIGLSLGAFTLWALLSWVSSIAPLIAVLENRRLFPSLLRSLCLGKLTSKLVELNFVLGIVKMALIVLAMVFCATPLPFQSVASGTPLYLYFAFITVLYLAASDFFQVARLAAFIQFWKALQPPETAKGTRR